ncbi:MAG: hypothetical protein K8U57_14200 [Planctomycetes bacterium]|nr:hypothetical protein [Planctomycetota bacterium]
MTEPNAGDVEVPRSESGNVTSAEPPEPKPSNREIVRDAAGRPIPAALASQFVAARDANRDAQKLVKELRKFIGSMAHQEWGKGIPAILSTVEAETKTVGENVASSIPAYLCPHTDDAGVHVQPGNCKVCHGRGWLSRHVYRQLPDPVKQICKDRAEKAGEETEPCDDPESEVTVHENDDKRGGGWNGHVSSRRAS